MNEEKLLKEIQMEDMIKAALLDKLLDSAIFQEKYPELHFNVLSAIEDLCNKFLEREVITH